MARWVLSKDRGKSSGPGPVPALASRCFSKVEPHLRHDLLRIPYLINHVLLQ